MEYRELLDVAGTYAEELDGASRKPLCHLTTIAYSEHDEKEGPVSEVHTLQIQRGTRVILLISLEKQRTLAGD